MHNTLVRNDVVDLPPSPASDPATFQIYLGVFLFDWTFVPDDSLINKRHSLSLMKGMKGTYIGIRRSKFEGPVMPFRVCNSGARVPYPPHSSYPIRFQGCCALSSPTVAPMPLKPHPQFNHNLTRLLCAMDAVVNVQTSKPRKTPQVKIRKFPSYALSFKEFGCLKMCVIKAKPTIQQMICRIQIGVIKVIR
ncbi:hypothetical protein RF11_10370 [Thelohanellus kitauei]|uniref:Uncharacterized protein n=1 Tax=Thelohanellus kitauei TaxID=669202 RepID=A0A0C2JPH1_THEKT|nr:hypothetical protein RF11_10370 [Thelohanellus kitauei]